MLRNFAFTILAVVLLVFSPSITRAQDVDVDELFSEAITLYWESQSSSEDDKSQAYVKVRGLFDQILRDYPNSRPAKLIGETETPGGVVLADLPTATPKGWNDGMRGIARELLADFKNDVEEIESVAGAAIYAYLAWAAYESDEPIKFLEQRGWKLVESYKGDRGLVGDVTASLFVNAQNEHVLAFRGSVTGGDWVTNVGGTLSPTPLLNGQVKDAIKLAEEVAKRFPEVIFTGHSLGGRLAQASSLKTGNIAYAFNSAPVGYNEIRKMGFAELVQGKMRRFRSPQDQLSGIFTPSDIVVHNIEEVDAKWLFNLVNLKDYTHAMSVLAKEMESVGVAWRNGWITAYRNEQLQDETQPNNVSADGDWGAEILDGLAGILEEYRPCSGSANPRSCLSSKGASSAAIEFILAVNKNPADISSFPEVFRETGKVDIAQMEWHGASGDRWSILLNGNPKEMPIEGTFDLAAIFTDPTSQKALKRFPQATSRTALVRSHRLLLDGTQRFVLVETIVDGCRACPILGSAVTFLEIGPATGGSLRRTPVGLLLSDPSDSVDMSDRVLRERPASLQVMLNIRGFDAGEMDGYAGPQTRTALMAFQAEHCIPVTGQPDSDTTRAILVSDSFQAPCERQKPPDGVSANTPLLAGVYVTNLSSCHSNGLSSSYAHNRQFLGEVMSLGGEWGCKTERTDIRQGITLSRGTCFDETGSAPKSWRFDVQSNKKFVDIDMGLSLEQFPPTTFERCPDESNLHQALYGDGEVGEQEGTPETISNGIATFEPARGTDLRKSILDAVRPVAEDYFGPSVEFVVDTIRVLDRQAYVELAAQRPNGMQIDIASTPAAKRGEVDFGVGNANIVSGFLTEQAGEWKPRDIKIQATEAWWLGNCDGLERLMPETCGEANQAVAADAEICDTSRRSISREELARRLTNRRLVDEKSHGRKWELILPSRKSRLKGTARLSLNGKKELKPQWSSYGGGGICLKGTTSKSSNKWRCSRVIQCAEGSDRYALIDDFSETPETFIATVPVFVRSEKKPDIQPSKAFRLGDVSQVKQRGCSQNWNLIQNEPLETAAARIANSFKGCHYGAWVHWQDMQPYFGGKGYKEFSRNLHLRFGKSNLRVVPGTNSAWAGWKLKEGLLNDPNHRYGETSVYFTVGTVEEVRVLGARAATGQCDVNVRFRLWFSQLTKIGRLMMDELGKDSITFSNCYRVGRGKFEWVFNSIDEF